MTEQFVDFFDTVATASGRPQRLRPEQKPVDLIRENIRKNKVPGAVLFDPCMRTGSDANSCLLESKHRTFTGFEAYSHFMIVVMPLVFCLFAVQMLNFDLDIEEGPNVGAEAER